MAGRQSGSGSSSAGAQVSLQDLADHRSSQVQELAASVAVICAPADQQMPINDLLENVADQREALPSDDPQAQVLDGAIERLTNLVRMLFVSGPYDTHHESAPAPPSPEQQHAQNAQLLQDLTENNLESEASDMLGVVYLSSASGPIPWPVKGGLYGPSKRPLVCLPTSRGPNKPYKNIFFLVDTGSPITEVSPKAFEALGVEAIPRFAYLYINGVRHQVVLCAPTGNHPDIPLLGANVMTALGLELRVNYKTDRVTLTEAPDELDDD